MPRSKENADLDIDILYSVVKSISNIDLIGKDDFNRACVAKDIIQDAQSALEKLTGK